MEWQDQGVSSDIEDRRGSGGGGFGLGGGMGIGGFILVLIHQRDYRAQLLCGQRRAGRFAAGTVERPGGRIRRPKNAMCT